MSNIPGGAVTGRPLHFIVVADKSGSMKDFGKIKALNVGFREALPAMQKAAADNPFAQVLVRVIGFADSAHWVVSKPTPVAEFKWSDLSADGQTAMGEALAMVAAEMDTARMPQRGLPPVLVLISDGKPSNHAEFERGLKTLLDQPWGKKAVKVAIAIGQDADEGVLQKFIDNAEIKPLPANNAEALVKFIKFVSTAVLKAASSPVNPAAPVAANVPIPVPPAVPAGVADTW